jgi:hypothetical protein
MSFEQLAMSYKQLAISNVRLIVIGFKKVFYGSKNQQNEKNKIDNLNLNKNHKEISNNTTIIQSKFFKAQSSKAHSS